MDAVTRRRLLMLGPLGLAAAGSGVFWALLLRMQQGSYDPHALQSMLIGKPLPDFTLPGQAPSSGFSNTDVNRGPLPALVNFFASWCIPCIEEAPALDGLRRQGVTIWGIAYKDKMPAAAGFLTATAIRTTAWRATRTGGRRSISASTACPRPTWSIAPASCDCATPAACRPIW